MEKVILRPIEFDDVSILHTWRNDESLFSQLGSGYFPVSKSEMETWMSNYSKLDKNNVRLIIQFEMRPVGYISLTNINYLNKNAELGIYIGENNMRGKGVAKEALKKLEIFAKNHLGLKKIKLLVNDNNDTALNFYKKQNYRVVGTYKEERYIYNEWIDVTIMEKMI
ncbi:GNAT family protein [Staphylococcus chromogenes]|uniref:GNAT family N-acetyltransferase n=2 Tax=Staphylococcus chromogenes TaxID=46126 RepID=UPI0018E568D1|nr:GNAT family protein [Staphylococcus chromogenes]MDT0693614.1 GNAT family protein [Staphylococcus chromogenes]MDT0701162.1 GNAT family protein [Staphylococcus chromogenes]